MTDNNIDEPVVTMRDAYKAGYCVNGAKAFCQRHGLDFRRFVRNGIPVSEIEQINDAMLKKVIEIAQQKQH